MPLDGLRAWIGEVERKLGMRTRVFLVLAALAIGGAGAAIYLALDTRDAAVSESDVRRLQKDLEAQIAGGGTTTGTSLSELEADLRELEAKVDRLAGKTGAAAESGGTNGGSADSGTEFGGADGDTGTASSVAPDAGTAAADPSAAQLQDVVEEAKRQGETTK